MESKDLFNLSWRRSKVLKRVRKESGENIYWKNQGRLEGDDVEILQQFAGPKIVRRFAWKKIDPSIQMSVTLIMYWRQFSLVS